MLYTQPPMLGRSPSSFDDNDALPHEHDAGWNLDFDYYFAKAAEPPTIPPPSLYLIEDELESAESSSDGSLSPDSIPVEWITGDRGLSNEGEEDFGLEDIIELPEEGNGEDFISLFPEPPHFVPTRLPLLPETYTGRRGCGFYDLLPANYGREIRTCVDGWLTIRKDAHYGTITLTYPCAKAGRGREIYVDGFDAISSIEDFMRGLSMRPDDLPPGVHEFHGRQRWLVIREIGAYIRARIKSIDQVSY